MSVMAIRKIRLRTLSKRRWVEVRIGDRLRLRGDYYGRVVRFSEIGAIVHLDETCQGVMDGLPVVAVDVGHDMIVENMEARR